jgi:hypothetical protein
MSKVLVLGAATLAFSATGAGVAWADGTDVPAPDYGYAAPAPAVPAAPPVYAAPQVYVAPVYTAPQVYVVPAPVYTAPVVTAPIISRPIYAYAPHGWHGHWHNWH